MQSYRRLGRFLSLCLAAAALGGGAGGALLGLCGPFTDVTADTFCPLVLEIFYLGITTGTTPTTYDPTSSVNRLQMATFLSRTVDGVLKRGSRRAAFRQNWTSKVLALTTVGSGPFHLQPDGADVWVANSTSNTVSRVRASDGRLLETWTGATGALEVLVAMGQVVVAGLTTPGTLYMIDPTRTVGAVTTVASTLGTQPRGIAFDGERVWTANSGSVSIITPTAAVPWTVSTVSMGFNFNGAVYDGANVWVAGNSLALVKLDSSGTILQQVTVGSIPASPVFDGSSIWVPNFGSASVSVVRASNGAILQTLTGNGLSEPDSAAFDGERILVTNFSGNSVSLWKAADLTPLGNVPTGAGTGPQGACSDGLNFWITLGTTGKLARF